MHTQIDAAVVQVRLYDLIDRFAASFFSVAS
jgi:hypothetical protein